MKIYKELLQTIIAKGIARDTRNGIRHTVINQQLVFDLRDGFPIVTIKQTNWKLSFIELLWFITGSTNVNDFNKLQEKYLGKVVPIWDKFCNDKGNIGPIYGAAWRRAPKGRHNQPMPKKLAPDANEEIIYGFDQLQFVLENLKHNPDSTRHRIATYIPSAVGNEELSMIENIAYDKGGITPCVSFLQFTSLKDEKTNERVLHLTLHHASNDVLLGGPFNIAQYALLLALVAREVNMVAGTLCINITDAHIYDNQMPMLDSSGLLERETLPLPTLEITSDKSIYDITLDDIKVINYVYHPYIEFPLS